VDPSGSIDLFFCINKASDYEWLKPFEIERINDLIGFMSDLISDLSAI
jgi:hypothetical protein